MQEKIGNVTLDYEYYPGEDLYSDGPVEEELLEMTIQVEEYIESIEKSELRIIFRLYFLDDLSYPKVADQMNKMFPKRRIRYTDENVRKKIQRYFENVPLEKGDVSKADRGILLFHSSVRSVNICLSF